MKKILILVLILAMILCMAGCGNKKWFDTTYNFNIAIIQLADGTIVKGKVQSWTDFEDGDQVQVTIYDDSENGVTTYWVHSLNCSMISE